MQAKKGRRPERIHVSRSVPAIIIASHSYRVFHDAFFKLIFIAPAKLLMRRKTLIQSNNHASQVAYISGVTGRYGIFVDRSICTERGRCFVRDSEAYPFRPSFNLYIVDERARLRLQVAMGQNIQTKLYIDLYYYVNKKQDTTYLPWPWGAI
jgi:hypothetical protein